MNQPWEQIADAAEQLATKAGDNLIDFHTAMVKCRPQLAGAENDNLVRAVHDLTDMLFMIATTTITLKNASMMADEARRQRLEVERRRARNPETE